MRLKRVSKRRVYPIVEREITLRSRLSVAISSRELKIIYEKIKKAILYKYERKRIFETT